MHFHFLFLSSYCIPNKHQNKTKQGWLVTRWNKTLFQETLPDLVKYDMLAFPGSRPRSPKKRKNKPNNNSNDNNSNSKSNKNNGDDDDDYCSSCYNDFISKNSGTYNADLELEEGVVFLPFCAHVCKELVGGIDKLKPYYAISFVKKSELPGHALWKGTMAIDGDVMQHRLGKRLDQEEVYCTFQPKDIYESMEDAHVSKDDVMEMLLSIEDFENIRMIRLRPLRQHEPPSVFRNSKVEPETGGFIGLNLPLGRKRFKEYKQRGRNKPPPPPPPPPKAKAKAKTPKAAAVVVYDSDSEVHTDYHSDSENDAPFDTYSDSSSDEDEADTTMITTTNTNAADSDVAKPLKDFDPCDPERIPQTTHYFPYPALDIASYMVAKDMTENDRVMAFYAKQWGPKSSRKKNKKQDIAKQDYQRFKETQRDYLSSNHRISSSIRRKGEPQEDGYKWTMVGSESESSESDSDYEESNIRHHRCRRRKKKDGGWKLSLTGDDPEAHLVPKIVELAKRDNETMASLQLFEMKNPGFKKHSRTWANDNSYTSKWNRIECRIECRIES